MARDRIRGMARNRGVGMASCVAIPTPLMMIVITAAAMAYLMVEVREGVREHRHPTPSSL